MQNCILEHIPIMLLALLCIKQLPPASAIITGHPSKNGKDDEH